MTINAVSGATVTMRLENLLFLHSCLNLQVINILGHILKKDIFVLQFFNEFMAEGWLEFTNQEFFGECKKGGWVFFKVVDFKDSFGIGEFVLLKLTVKACSWTPKIRNTSSDAQSCSGQHQYFFELFLFQSLNRLLESKLTFIFL